MHWVSLHPVIGSCLQWMVGLCWEVFVLTPLYPAKTRSHKVLANVTSHLSCNRH